MNEPTAVPRRRTGERSARVHGRSERVVRAVLDATVVELGRVGYGALRVEDVAAQAGVNKTTVYRRWPTKRDLVEAALTDRALEKPEPPDTGSLRADLIGLMAQITEMSCSPEAKGIIRMMTAERADPDVHALSQSIRERHFARRLPIVERAVARGELPAGIDPRLLLEVALAPLFLRLRISNDPVDDRFIAEVVDLVLEGAKRR